MKKDTRNYTKILKKEKYSQATTRPPGNVEIADTCTKELPPQKYAQLACTHKHIFKSRKITIKS